MLTRTVTGSPPAAGPRRAYTTTNACATGRSEGCCSRRLRIRWRSRVHAVHREILMRAIRVHQYGGPEAMVVDDVPVPQPGPGQVLVKLHTAGVNYIDV